MLKAPTALVLGAGASVDFGLPVGATLAKDISQRLTFRFRAGELLTGDEEIARELHSRAKGSPQAYFLTAAAIADGILAFKSIDDYLYTHSGDPLAMAVGKMAIARSIANLERESTLYPLWGHDNDLKAAALNSIRESWIHTLIQMLITGLRREDRSQIFNNLMIINFNYDRCIDTALYYGIQAPLRIDGQEAAQILGALKIFHPYGSLGALSPTDASGLPYGPEPSTAVKSEQKIQVYTEDLGDRPDLLEMASALAATEQVIFLGFGYHRQNMTLLDIGTAKNLGGRRAYGTAFNESGPAREVIEERIRGSLMPAGRPTITPSQYDCKRTLSEYAIALGK